MTDPLLQRAREGRSSSATLKAELSNARSRFPNLPILVFEGRDDVGPYEVWIRRIAGRLDYREISGRGKRQLLELRRSLHLDITGLAEKVFLFVDRDFDELQGQAPGPDIFVTEEYSIENAMIDEQAVASIVSDELGIPSWHTDHGKTMALYRRIKVVASSALREPNFRLYVGIQLGLLNGRIEERIGRYVHVEVDNVRAIFTEETLKEYVPYSLEPSDEDRERFAREFQNLHPPKHYRGKFWLGFLKKWLECVAEERSSGARSVFGEPQRTRLHITELTLRSLASRSPLPSGLKCFVEGIARETVKT